MRRQHRTQCLRRIVLVRHCLPVRALEVRYDLVARQQKRSRIVQSGRARDFLRRLLRNRRLSGIRQRRLGEHVVGRAGHGVPLQVYLPEHLELVRHEGHEIPRIRGERCFSGYRCADADAVIRVHGSNGPEERRRGREEGVRERQQRNWRRGDLEELTGRRCRAVNAIADCARHRLPAQCRAHGRDVRDRHRRRRQAWIERATPQCTGRDGRGRRCARRA